VYDLPAEVLDTLSLKTGAEVQDGSPFNEMNEAIGDSRSSSPGPENVVGSQACSLCSLSFATVQDQRSHLKSDLHHYNLKQKLRGLNPVSEAEFEKLIGSAYYILVLEIRTLLTFQTSTKACPAPTLANPKTMKNGKRPHYRHYSRSRRPSQAGKVTMATRRRTRHQRGDAEPATHP
jgi:hypothetical protein